MHVLPLPFGLALAVMPRRDADKIRPPKDVPLVGRVQSPRERLLSDTRYAGIRQRFV
jgi:hypothetical protein